jgi:hypothetical protein
MKQDVGPGARDRIKNEAVLICTSTENLPQSREPEAIENSQQMNVFAIQMQNKCKTYHTSDAAQTTIHLLVIQLILWCRVLFEKLSSRS